MKIPGGSIEKLSGERRLLACPSRQPAEMSRSILDAQELSSVRGCSRQAAGYCRLAACAPQKKRADSARQPLRFARLVTATKSTVFCLGR